MSKVDRPTVVSWRRLDFDNALECVRVEHVAERFLIEGRTVMADPPDPWWFSYALTTDVAWHTLTLALESATPDARRSLVLECSDGQWSFIRSARDILHPDHEALRALAGCLDVDLFGSIFTNTLPIRRLDLRLARSADIEVVWIDVPSLCFERATQRYSRLEDGSYEFRPLGSDARYSLMVDEDGLVVDYEGFARRLGKA